MKKKVFFKYDGDESFEKVGVAESTKSAEAAVRYHAFDTEADMEVEDTKEGYFVTIYE